MGDQLWLCERHHLLQPQGVPVRRPQLATEREPLLLMTRHQKGTDMQNTHIRHKSALLQLGTAGLLAVSLTPAQAVIRGADEAGQVVTATRTGSRIDAGVAGVIQIFTRRGHVGSEVEASVTGGSDGFHQATAAWSGGVERWQGAVTVSDQATRGFSSTNPLASTYHPDRDGFRQQSLQGSLSHDIATGWR